MAREGLRVHARRRRPDTYCREVRHSDENTERMVGAAASRVEHAWRLFEHRPLEALPYRQVVEDLDAPPGIAMERTERYSRSMTFPLPSLMTEAPPKIWLASRAHVSKVSVD